MWKVFTHFQDLKHESPHTRQKVYRCKHNEAVCIHLIHRQTNEIIQSVTNLTNVRYIGTSSLIPITKKYMQDIRQERKFSPSYFGTRACELFSHADLLLSHPLKY
jgi:hypothetical protein